MKRLTALIAALALLCPLSVSALADGRRNDSRKLPRVAEVIAQARRTTPELVARVCMENGKRFFGIE